MTIEQLRKTKRKIFLDLLETSESIKNTPKGTEIYEQLWDKAFNLFSDYGTILDEIYSLERAK